jgi:hypothetical protein
MANSPAAVILTFAPPADTDPAFAQTGTAQLLLRRVSLAPLDACDASKFSPSFAFAAVQLMTCEDRFMDPAEPNVRQFPCFDQARDPAACSNSAAGGVSCQCREPAYVNPDWPDDPALAPYQLSGQLPPGCIQPNMMDRLLVVSYQVGRSCVVQGART